MRSGQPAVSQFAKVAHMMTVPIQNPFKLPTSAPGEIRQVAVAPVILLARAIYLARVSELLGVEMKRKIHNLTGIMQITNNKKIVAG